MLTIAQKHFSGRCGHDCMVIRFTTICAIGAYNNISSSPVHGEVYSIEHYMILFISDLQHVCGFLRVLWVPPSIKLTTTISLKYC